MCIREGRGFTLVEIMIVVAIIGLLSMIAITMFVNARAQASQETCRMNMKQVENAAHMFAFDNSGVYPAGATVADIQGSLVPYMRSVPTACPDGGAYTYNQATGSVGCPNGHTI